MPSACWRWDSPRFHAHGDFKLVVERNCDICFRDRNSPEFLTSAKLGGMGHRGRRLLGIGLLVACASASARAQSSVNGNVIALRSSGSASGTDWTLSENGYVGSYITL